MDGSSKIDPSALRIGGASSLQGFDESIAANCFEEVGGWLLEIGFSILEKTVFVPSQDGLRSTFPFQTTKVLGRQ
jgi:hypothetical protein